ncbi:MAG: C39 family peptidase [Candidatus Aegiribacteria sp.]|nr:C39 family peptidase [Candidatus Aegiribacteria sp.]
MDSTGKMRWKHQRLNNGCAWTCLAMLLSRRGIDIEAEQIVAESITIL